MTDQQEIIITTSKFPDEPRGVDFGELYDLHRSEDIITMMLLWNHNSYYVNSQERTFIVNGGRKMVLEQLGECKFLYRRRTQFEVGMNNLKDVSGPKDKRVNWLIGFEEIGTAVMVLLQISEDGLHWMWADSL